MYLSIKIFSGCKFIIFTSGTARIINRQKSGSFGTMFKIVPVTNSSVTNQITCFKVEGERGLPVVPQGVLPNASLYKVCICCTNAKQSLYFVSNLVYP